mmetsp:Transcript_63493/g.112928  ORF Transcript_63493/g.112928 Transcript_63493/m.112928 type:complete len:508 (+) Transcript_63493:120-1643(+)
MLRHLRPRSFRGFLGFARLAGTESEAQGAYGSKFWREAQRFEKRQEELKQAKVTAAGPPPGEETPNPEEETKKQLGRMFLDLPGHTSPTTAYLLHQRGVLEPTVKPPLDRETFEQLYVEVREQHFKDRRANVARKRRKRRNFALLNTGYKEEDDVYDAEEEEFDDGYRQQSIVEDCWKADYYQSLTTMELKKTLPEREVMAQRTDRMADVLQAAVKATWSDQNRPVLTHELADFENPYMMKRSALERLLHERCVRNELDERCLPRLLDRHPDLVKLRRQAALPPEVLEPLAAFRGDVRWHFDARERLGQKLVGAEAALDAVVAGEEVSKVVAALPENQTESPPADQVPGLHHPWRNHVGFETAVPRGVAGGTKFGQPEPALTTQNMKLRYPTLQQVAHTLPADPKWRAHVVRSIRVLERSKDWDFQSKLTAVNKLKEVYDQLKPSDVYTAALDEKLPVNRVPSHLKRKYAPDAQYVRTYPKHFLKKKSFYRYRPSLTATTPLVKSKK